MIINNISCPDTIGSFNNAVWLYGAMGTDVLSDLSEPQKEVIFLAWADVARDVEDNTASEEEIDNRINSFYNDFVKVVA